MTRSRRTGRPLGPGLGPALGVRSADLPPGELSVRPSLPVRGAFVVRLRAEADPARGATIGRVEHVATAESASFASIEELVAFMARTFRGRP